MQETRQSVGSMRHGLSTLTHFTWRGFTYGAGVGAISGTLVFPILGTTVAGIAGAVVGSVIGFVLGILILFYNAFAHRQQTDFESYQQNLMILAATITTSITAVAAYLFSPALDLPLLTLPFIALLAPFSGFTAAYVAHNYTDHETSQVVKRKNDANILEVPNDDMTVNQFFKYYFRKSSSIYFPMLGLLLISGSIHIIFNSTLLMVLLNILNWILVSLLGWTFYFVLSTMLIGFTNGLFIQMLNRIVFSPELTHADYSKRLMIVVGLFTLLITPIIGLGIGTVIFAILATLAARDYANWRYQFHPQKIKRDTRRLAENYLPASDDEIYAEEDAALEISQR